MLSLSSVSLLHWHISSRALHIGDTGNNRVRMVNLSTGVISTIAGNGVAGNSGDGGIGSVAELNQPIGVSEDGANNLYIADSQNGSIRELAYSSNYTSGAISTLISGFVLTNDVSPGYYGNIVFSDPF